MSQPASSPPTASLPPIVQTGAPVLRGAAADVAPERIHTPEFQDLVKTMIDVMRQAPGVGLAAPQIGIPLRLIVLEDREEFLSNLSPEERAARGRVSFPTRVFVNPVLELVGKETATFFEGCLSVAGYVALVERHLAVEVHGLDEHGEPQGWRVRGWPARILQHEVDHINGTLYIDRMKTRSFCTTDHAKEHYADKSIAEILRLLNIES
ncbi:MAG TPA: peptide deformylase [Polyangiaceae bacterium]|nr:peptide deformylase [Polyangiaceae bacterium]